MNVLQSLVHPDLTFGSPDNLYWRLNERAWIQRHHPELHFEPGGISSSDTFYNGLTVRAWKRDAQVATLGLRLEGEGAFIITWGLHRAGASTAWVDEQPITLTSGTPETLHLRGWAGMGDGMLFFRLRSLSGGVLRKGAFITLDAPRQAVVLGVVITHYNRAAQVLPGIDRIRALLDARADLEGLITLTVIDNSRNLPLDDSPGVQVIANRNLGGTGGFVRGLLALQDGGFHTHALFMDDDASCEIESIARTHALLLFAAEPELAVAGALLRELAPWHLLEKGARFDGLVRPICAGLDMRHVDDLLAAERNAIRPDYGAWWFFAFPLAAVRRFPFPFFVRGDDIDFGLANRFRITTLNGVACFGDDFGVKHQPLTAYLDARYHAVQALLASRGSWSALLGSAGRAFVKSIASYHYSSARAVTLGLRHVLEGPGFFAANLDLQSVRREIGAWQPDEKLRPIDIAGLDLRGPRRGRESGLRKFVRVLTLQGFLLPPGLIRNRTTVQEKHFHGNASALFRYRRVLYLHAVSGQGYMAEYDRRRFFAELGAFIGTLARLAARLPALRRTYGTAAPSLGSEAFWRGVYGLGAARDGAALPAESADAGRPTASEPSAVA